MRVLLPGPGRPNASLLAERWMMQAYADRDGSAGAAGMLRDRARARKLVAVPILMILLGVPGGCERSAEPAGTAAVVLQGDEVAEPGNDLDATRRFFDAGALEPGDTLLGLAVASIEVEPAQHAAGHVGAVVWSGEVTVSGHYRAHPDYPQPGAELLCFFVDNETAHLLPRFRHDERYPWFCFTNHRDAVSLLGPPQTEGAATVTIDEYRTVREFTDAFDTARLVRLVSKGAEILH
jgi:hypothetical protein